MALASSDLTRVALLSNISQSLGKLDLSLGDRRVDIVNLLSDILNRLLLA